MLRLPENFESFPEARKSGFMKMKAHKDNGGKIVGTYCSFIPTELIMAAGAIPVTLCATSEEPIAAAQEHLPSNLCPLIKASYGFALTDTCPYFYFSDFIVGETTCDGKKKMFELMNDIKNTYVMQLPSSRDEVALTMWEAEIKKFWKKLEDFYGVTITEEDVKKAILQKNAERDLVLEYLDLGKLNPSPISGYELGTKLDTLSFIPSMEERCKQLRERIDEVKADWEANYNGKVSRKPRILITGCPNGGVRDKTIKVLEELGADVVAFDACNSNREKIEKVDTTLPVTEALAKKYLNINCSVMSPNTNRLKFISDMIDDYQVDGVLEIILQACHTFSIESYNVKKSVLAKKIPYLKVETDYSKADAGQINTRLEAFLETIAV
ncbi:double-cubane-cluster-containing anaerobic reductase [Lachnoanaerobaculum saburreum]|uniref:2-hydroxyglutaryl-CoA dehydratase, D-component n=1 Tax=Lachnoanaerobaculum saburreum TaxID=467210 RepID=A0A133ZDE7_9FIRM|nr:double-cubane-cluster-containing anaerobic reductase [Lachnoanaerobaculum saburreum]KXB53472.1 2-hydroxyglutaryl-CoA dehydratase, D-component [Lachnoanaerobaculum saburreum]